MAGAAQARGRGQAAAGGGGFAAFTRPLMFALKQVWETGGAVRLRGLACALFGAGLLMALLTRHADDPSWNVAGGDAPRNLLGGFGATLSDVAFQSLGYGAWIAALILIGTGLARLGARDPRDARRMLRLRATVGTLGVLCLAGAIAAIPVAAHWDGARSYGGFWGLGLLNGIAAAALRTFHAHRQFLADGFIVRLRMPYFCTL